MLSKVHYPNDPWQPGPIYFKTPRKCAIFGVNNESIPRQVNYLIDEASATGKGGNVVASMLHFNFENYGLGEEECYLYADNCVGQNKNNIVVKVTPLVNTLQLFNIIFTVPCLAGSLRAAQDHSSLFSFSGTHQVHTRCMFRCFQEEVPQDQSQLSG